MAELHAIRVPMDVAYDPLLKVLLERKRQLQSIRDAISAPDLLVVTQSSVRMVDGRLDEVNGILSLIETIQDEAKKVSVTIRAEQAAKATLAEDEDS